MSELKPCPFCGGRPAVIEDGYKAIAVHCFNCGADITAETEGKARATWNRRTQPANSRFADCHIWEPGDRLDTISDKCDVLIKAADIRELMGLPANDKVRPIDANTLSDEISRLQIFLSGESLFTPAIKETVLRTIDEQATIAVSHPSNEPLTLDELRGMDGEPVWVADNRSGSSAWMQYAYEEAAYDLIAFWEFGSEVESAYCALDYGKTWLAYRRKPETKGV